MNYKLLFAEIEEIIYWCLMQSSAQYKRESKDKRVLSTSTPLHREKSSNISVLTFMSLLQSDCQCQHIVYACLREISVVNIVASFAVKTVNPGIGFVF